MDWEPEACSREVIRVAAIILASQVNTGTPLRDMIAVGRLFGGSSNVPRWDA
jgi:hypothetical protein